MFDAELQELREINRHLPFAHPIAKTTVTAWVVFIPGGTNFGPRAPRVGDLVNVIPVTISADAVNGWGHHDA